MPKKSGSIKYLVTNHVTRRCKAKVDRKLKSLIASSIVIAVILGLLVPVQALTTVSGTVYNPDGTCAEGVLVTATNLNTGDSGSDTTDGCGTYSIPLPFGTSHYVKIVATKGNLYAETTVPYVTGGSIEADLTLKAAAAPALTPIGLVALVSLLSALAVLTMRRKRR
jgi:hypothetical protein